MGCGGFVPVSTRANINRVIAQVIIAGTFIACELPALLTLGILYFRNPPSDAQGKHGN